MNTELRTGGIPHASWERRTVFSPPAEAQGGRDAPLAASWGILGDGQADCSALFP